MKCWYNTLLQVLTNAPSLHSLIVRYSEDVTDILKFLTHTQGDLKKLIFKYCSLGEDSTDLFANIVDLYPNLEVLSLEDCAPLSTAVYRLIPHLKELSELKLSNIKVNCMYVKHLETHVCIREHMWENTPRNALSIFRQERNLLHFEIMIQNISFILHKMAFILWCYLFFV